MKKLWEMSSILKYLWDLIERCGQFVDVKAINQKCCGLGESETLSKHIIEKSLVKFEKFILSCLFPTVFYIRSVSSSEISLIKFSVKPAIPGDPWETSPTDPYSRKLLFQNPHFISFIYQRLTEHRLPRNQSGVHMQKTWGKSTRKISKYTHFE